MTEYADVNYGKLLRKQMLAGGLAGMLADAVMYPMMTVKSRLMVRASGLGPAFSRNFVQFCRNFCALPVDFVKFCTILFRNFCEFLGTFVCIFPVSGSLEA